MKLGVQYVFLFLGLTGSGMEIQWTRMAGQWPVEASPIVVPSADGGRDDILILNRGGQMLLWTSEGTPIGSGQDGMVAQLPNGQWTTAPALMDAASATRFVVTSLEGLVIGLDPQFRTLWQHKLPGQTVWDCALPASIKTPDGPALVFTDLSGTSTCLSPDGKVIWTNALAAGACKAPARTFSPEAGVERILVPAGSTLFCCDNKGLVRWRRDLAGKNRKAGKTDYEIVTRPEVISHKDHAFILCGTADGRLFALNLNGKVLWECTTGDPLSHSITVLPRRGSTPLILFTGLWGNLHAVDIEGRRVWTHLFRAKVRAAPLVLDDDNGHSQIFVPTFHQHVFQFNENGELNDDIRLSGIMPSALTPVTNKSDRHSDLLVTTTTLLAYRLRPGPPKSQYGMTASPRNVSIRSQKPEEESESPKVENPNGALLKVQVSLTDRQGWSRNIGCVTARSAFEIPLPDIVKTGVWSCRVVALDSSGKLLDEKRWETSSERRAQLSSGTMIEREKSKKLREPPVTHLNKSSDTLSVWPTFPYGAFEETRLAPLDPEAISGSTNQILVPTLYLDETDQGAFIIASAGDETIEARISLTQPVRKDGLAFGGSMILREVVSTGSVNGEKVPDALPELNDAGLVRLLPKHSAKIWVSIDTHRAEFGNYTGSIVLTPLSSKLSKIELPLNLEILNVRLPGQFPLKLCTWDYVPNRWFPSRTSEVLDDMARHGVNIFPRTTIPPGRVDASGKLTIDWGVLDSEIARLEHRGKILFQLGHPPIAFAAEKSPEEKRAHELEYIRALRDRLHDRGWSHSDYAFYLLDEPGLDYGTNVPVLLDAGKLFREADPKLLTYTDPVPGLSWKDFQRIEPLVDVWAPNMRLVSGLLSGDPRIKQIMNAKSVWSYECVSQVKSLSPLCYNRANAWRAKFFGLSGIGFWTHSTTEVDIWMPGKTINDEYALVYPGQLPVPSVRWEAVRDGLEDVAAIVLLEEQIQRHREAGTQAELVKQADDEARIALRDIMELSDETFIESRDFLREGDRVLGHTWTDVKVFSHHRTEIGRLTLALSGAN